jgi:4-hydroxybenzoate polyprenyltransferase
MKVLDVIKLARVQQYVKNIFIFLPLFFALKITEIALFIDTFLAFLSFSLTASAIYILNDYFDIEQDKKHPIKKNRPLASGNISKVHALLIMTLLLILGLSLMFYLSLSATKILVLYVGMNIAYSAYFKHKVVIDITIIAIGFVLRIFVGSIVSNVTLSMWIVIMTFLLALFMALAKRRDDVIIYEKTKKKVRQTVDGYSLQFLDMAMSMVASVVIVSYIMYTTSAEVIHRVGSEYLYLTALFVILGVMRYLIITLVNQDSDSPTRIILKDSFIQLTLLMWIVSFAWILY